MRTSLCRYFPNFSNSSLRQPSVAKMSWWPGLMSASVDAGGHRIRTRTETAGTTRFCAIIPSACSTMGMPGFAGESTSRCRTMRLCVSAADTKENTYNHAPQVGFAIPCKDDLFARRSDRCAVHRDRFTNLSRPRSRLSNGGLRHYTCLEQPRSSPVDRPTPTQETRP